MENQEIIAAAAAAPLQEPQKAPVETAADFESHASEPGVLSRYLQCCDCV